MAHIRLALGIIDPLGVSPVDGRRFIGQLVPFVHSRLDVLSAAWAGGRPDTAGHRLDKLGEPLRPPDYDHCEPRDFAQRLQRYLLPVWQLLVVSLGLYEQESPPSFDKEQSIDIGG